jgi:hypothetical protein
MAVGRTRDLLPAGERADILVLARIAMVPLTLVMLGSTYAIGARLWSRRVGLWAAAMLASEWRSDLLAPSKLPSDPPLPSPHPTNGPATLLFDAPAGSAPAVIEIDRVTFAYADGDPPVLADIPGATAPGSRLPGRSCVKSRPLPTSFPVAPARTVNTLLVPVFPALVAVRENAPVFVIVTLCDASTPFTNAAVVTGLPASVPVEVSVTLDPKAVTVLLFTSCAVTLTAKDVPAVCAPMVPPPAASTRK